MTTRRLAAILAADVVGYSRLVSANEADALAQLRKLRLEIIEPTIAMQSGRLFKVMGDGFLAEFASAVQAVQCAIAIQRAVEGATESLDNSRTMRLRIGIYVGDVIVEGDDLMGDGINIAARLESIAAPGGISISRAVYDQVRDRIDVAFDDKGEVLLKNITRPVHVYALANGRATRAEMSSGSLSLPDRPSIAVLPFQNMSGDVEQEYFADGIVEDIIGALSRFTAFFVIARNSSFTYKGKAVDVRQVGRELGVRYVLEGSIRKSGNRIRIAGQLIEAATGRHIWADRFDGDLTDIFDLQDKITESVVAAIEPRMLAAEIQRSRQKPTGNLDAYDLYLRATCQMGNLKRGGLDEVLRLFLKSIEMDPAFASAYGLAAFSFVVRKNFNGLRSIGAAEIAEANRLARLAGKFGQHDAVALSHAGHTLGYVVLDVEAGLEFTDRAIAINNNMSAAWRSSGFMNLYAGRPETAIEHAERAIRLSPIDPYISALRAIVAFGHFNAGRYGSAIAWAEKTVRNTPTHLTGLRLLAASHALHGNLNEAKLTVAKILELDPELNVSSVKQLVPLRRSDDLKRYTDGLRLAGLPE